MARFPTSGNEEFTYSNGALETVSSSVWEALTGFTDVTVNTNQIVNQESFDTNVVRVATTEVDMTGSDDQEAQLVVQAAGSGSYGPGVFLSADDDGYFFTVNVGTTTGQFFHYKAGSYTNLGSAKALGATLAADDVIKITAEYNGSSETVLTAYLNDSSVGTETDASSPITSGQPGLVVFNNDSGTAALIDDYAAADTIGGIAGAAAGGGALLDGGLVG